MRKVVVAVFLAVFASAIALSDAADCDPTKIYAAAQYTDDAQCVAASSEYKACWPGVCVYSPATACTYTVSCSLTSDTT